MNELLPFCSETSSLPLLSSMCLVRRGGNFRIDGMTVNRPILCLILQGEGLLALNDIVYEAQSGELFLINPGVTVDALSNSEFTQFLVLSMENMCVQRVCGHWKAEPSPAPPLNWPSGKIRIRHKQQAAVRMSRLYDSYRGELSEPFTSIHSQLQELLQFLSEHRLEANLEKVDPTLERSIMYMRRFMNESISMDHLAKIAGLTPSSYSRSFKKAKGMSPTEYLNRMRIEEAKKLLAEGNCVLKEVAETVGYGNEYYFSRKFKQVLGIAPSIYMKKHDLRVATISHILNEHLLALGLQPVESLDLKLEKTDTSEQKRSLTKILDQLRRSKPDLIIGDSSCKPYVDDLKSIAPTVIVEVIHDWKTIHLHLAELIGRETLARQHVKEFLFHCWETATSPAIEPEHKSIDGSEQIHNQQVTPQTVSSMMRIPIAAHSPNYRKHTNWNVVGQ
ncbi:MAG: helix-turn-helix domain-containing protein [Paenibacillus sp.]|uniref:helix-turn-helix domain-containing protein n=1 Tax=Paenibacillus sp. TaxID=58172 RepID=UPI0025FC2D65|nr:helix-turn-helix domain-containing protein [Paenibacillus sp.]MBR2567083.1 helix-turn-helix domain-containing protein [Paenibacillus sp.]